MPLYTYRCPKCKTQVERSRAISDRDKAECQFCHSPMDRLIDFHGSVWAPTAGGMK